MTTPDLLKTVSNEFSRVFRHILPGFLILGIMYGSHPTWFGSVDISKWTHIIILLVIALMTGNIWYVVHRYTFHNIFDWLMYCYLHRKITGYIKWVSDHIITSFSLPGDIEKLQRHIHFRSAQIIFLFIISEALILFSKWNEAKSPIHEYSCTLFLIGCVLFVVAIIQFVIAFLLDIAAADKHSLHASAQQSAGVDSENRAAVSETPQQ